MSLRTVLLVGFAIGAAALTAIMVRNWMHAQQAALPGPTPALVQQKPLPTREVLVAAKDLSMGTFVRPDHLRWQVWPETTLSADLIVKGKGDIADFEGAVVRNRLVAGEPVTRFRLVQPGEQGFLAAVLAPDMRAVSVPLDATTGISGFVFPGDIVDVVLTFRVKQKKPGDEGSEVTRYFSETLLQKVRVLAVDQRVDNSDGLAKPAKTATLEVTPGQAERIALGMQIGALSLSLRGLDAAQDVAIAQLDSASESPVANVGSDSRRPPRLQSAAEPERSYTRDVDVYFMLGDPLGMPNPGAQGPSVVVLRGSKEERVQLKSTAETSAPDVEDGAGEASVANSARVPARSRAR